MKSRRFARIAALRALYAIEVGGAQRRDSIEGMRHALLDLAEENGHKFTAEELDPQVEYAGMLVQGIRENLHPLDDQIAGYVTGYDYQRLAAIDRNILRIGAYELLHIPEIPPAVSLNEAIEIAKKYSTGESGRFVNGVLASLLKDTPKKDWDPSTAPSEEIIRDDSQAIESETVDADSEEAANARKFGQWTIRQEE
ncbi:MAG TPA: transcription antitermination factor NusB [Fimbriimonas sp.]|nr:transcription antitermination factor NusB [Fimbriimonas sp.]